MVDQIHSVTATYSCDEGHQSLVMEQAKRGQHPESIRLPETVPCQGTIAGQFVGHCKLKARKTGVSYSTAYH